MRIARTLKDLGTSVTVAIVLLVLCELGLRATFRGKVTEREAEPNPLIAYAPHPEYIIGLKPNLRTFHTRDRNTGGEIIPWETNSSSFRGSELRTAAAIRVMVYGDSNIQASFSRHEDTFAFRLQQYLAERLARDDLEVVNSGVVGFGPDQSLIKLSLELTLLRPALVILNIFADNDFGDPIRNRLFDLTEDDRLVRTRFKIGRDEAFAVADRAAGATSVARQFLSSLLFVRATRKAAALLGHEGMPRDAATEIDRTLERAKKEFSVYDEGLPQQFSNFDDHYDVDVAIHPEAASSRVRIKLMGAILRQVREVTASKGVPLLVLIEPSATDVTEGQLVSYKDLHAYPDYRRENLSAAVDAICARERIDRVNLFETFAGHNAEQLYFRGPETHWNDRGQDLAAQVTAAYVAGKMGATFLPASSPARRP